MENKEKKTDLLGKRSTDEQIAMRCKRKCLFRAKRKLVFNEETEGGTTSPRKANLESSLLEDCEDFIEDMQQSNRDNCLYQYGFDIVTGESVDENFGWQVDTRPTNVLKCGKPRRSLVH